MSTTQHPLTETAAVEMWDASPCPEGYEFRGMLTVEQDATLYAMRAAFDAGREHERTTPEDDRPWESLNEDDPLRVGDEVRQELNGVTTIAVVGRVDGEGDPWTTEDRFIGVLDEGTWYVRRAVQELPTEDGAVIVPAEGREFIEAEVSGQTYIAREAVVCQSDFGPANVLEGAWRRADTGVRAGGQVSRDFITPGTWKVDDQ